MEESGSVRAHRRLRVHSLSRLLGFRAGRPRAWAGPRGSLDKEARDPGPSRGFVEA
nr:hypothetical protein KPHV_01760 [Kitasatospora purpeofusca]